MPGMEFGLLGPLAVRRDGQVLAVPRGNQRAVLAALLLEAGRVVSADRLTEVLWGPAPPPSAQVTLRTYVSRLRQVLGAEGPRISAQPRGYLIHVDDDELDISRFEAFLTSARAAARQASWEEAAAQARAGLALWRGEPLADLESDTLALAHVPRLAELRLQALETRIDAELHLGGHADVVAELRQLTAVHPLREPAHALLMLALYRCGRTGDALAAYQHARATVREELGLEPGAGLQQLHQQILRADPALSAPAAPAGPGGPGASGAPAAGRPEPAATAGVAAPPAAAAAGTGPAVADPAAGEQTVTVPRQLPGAVPHFTGRATELDALTQALDQAGGQPPGTVVISAVGGTAGVGKTALAIQWAHQVADRFPDGQLYVNLRGYDPDRPTRAADALAGFLRALGVGGQDIPPEEDERAARYRSVLAGKRMLVVLDNAGSVEQVRPLLPGTPGCAVAVTSRDALAGLVARHGAVRLELDLLPPDEAVGLLRELIGQRAGEDPGAAAALAAQCGRLPLALRVAAELAAAHPGVPLARLAGELAGHQRRLDLLAAGGDPRTAVRTVFSWSYRHLDDDAARAFRLAGLHPGADFDPYAAAALTGTTLEQSGAVLDALARAHLIQPVTVPGPGRFAMHDLLRAYARELTAAPDGQEERNAALTRLFDHYLHTASVAMDTLYPAERHRRPRIPPPATPVPPVTEPGPARAWLDTERATLVALTAHAAGYGWPGHATRLSDTLHRYLDNGGHYPEALTIHSNARTAAQRTGDRAAQATALDHLGTVHRMQGRYRQAADHQQRALALFRQAGDRSAQARALANLGIIRYFQGRYGEAISTGRQALAIFRETGDTVGEARTLNNVGASEERLGRYDLATRHHRQAQAIASDIAAPHLECTVLINLGTVGLRQGRFRKASGSLCRSLALCRETGYRDGEAEALARIGDLCLRQGRPEEATRHLQEALAGYRELGNRSGEADVLNSQGEVLLTTGQPDHAQTEFAAALGVAAQTGDKYQQARAHHGLGQACRADGDPACARRHWQHALDLFTELATPEAEQVRTEMTAAEHD